jgi:hypothetical protein
LDGNSQTQQIHAQIQEPANTGFADLVSGLGGLFDIQPVVSDYDSDEAEFQHQQAQNRKKKIQKRRGIGR